MKINAYIGIDPGIGKAEPGAAALIADSGYICFYDWQGEDTAEIALRKWDFEFHVQGIGIEKVWARPGEGYSSRLLENFGFWKGIARIITRPVEYKPDEWQQIRPAFFKGDSKTKSILTAKLFFPGLDDLLKFKKNHGRAEALLIGEHHKRLDRIRRMAKGG